MEAFNQGKSLPIEYFSGANCKVYFGDVWVDQMASIQYSIVENVQPIYGFNSYTFDRVARGNRMVQGQFVINFTQNGYLQSIIDSLNSNQISNNSEFYANQSDYYEQVTTETTIQKLLNAKQGASYDDYIASLKNSFWGQSGQTKIGLSKVDKEHSPHFYSKYQKSLYQDGFNVIIDFSPENSSADIQNCLEGLADGTSVYKTTRNIIGMQIVSMQQVLGNDGNPIQEVYSFIAKDLDGDVTKASIGAGFQYFN